MGTRRGLADNCVVRRPGPRRYRSWCDDCQGKLRELVDELSEAEAARALEVLIAGRGGERDALMEFLDSAPVDDEPATPEEEAAVQEALDAAARGETISLEELRAELDAKPR